MHTTDEVHLMKTQLLTVVCFLKLHSKYNKTHLLGSRLQVLELNCSLLGKQSAAQGCGESQANTGEQNLHK